MDSTLTSLNLPAVSSSVSTRSPLRQTLRPETQCESFNGVFVCSIIQLKPSIFGSGPWKVFNISHGKPFQNILGCSSNAFFFRRTVFREGDSEARIITSIDFLLLLSSSSTFTSIHIASHKQTGKAV